MTFECSFPGLALTACRLLNLTRILYISRYRISTAEDALAWVRVFLRGDWDARVGLSGLLSWKSVLRARVGHFNDWK